MAMFSVFIVVIAFSPVILAGTVAVPHRDTTLDELKSIDSFVSSALPVLQDGFFIGTSSGPVLVKSEPNQRLATSKRPSVKPGYYNTLPRLIPKGFEGIAVSHFNLGAANPYQPIASSKSLLTVPTVGQAQAQYVQPIQQAEQYVVDQAHQVYQPQQYVAATQHPQQYIAQQQFVQNGQTHEHFVGGEPQPQQHFVQPDQPQQQQFLQPEQSQQQQFFHSEQPQQQFLQQPEQAQQEFLQAQQPQEEYLQRQQPQQQFAQVDQSQQNFFQPGQLPQQQQLFRFPQQYPPSAQFVADSQQAAQEPTQISARSQPPSPVAEPSFQVDNLLRPEQEPASVTAFQTQVFGRERFQSQKLLRNEAVVATTEFEENLPEALRNRFYKNANLATILAQESLPIQGEQIISEWDTNKIAKGKIHALLSGAGLI